MAVYPSMCQLTMRSRWYGDNPGMQPKQGNHTPYRFVLTLQTFFSTYFLSYRTLTLGSMSWAGVSIFTCELFGLLVSLLYGALLQWTCSDTRHTTPSLSDFPHFPEDRWPTVTILITTFNETPPTLVPTITAACNIDWPSHKLCVYVCDDAPPQEDRTWLLKLCSKLKCTYIRRGEHSQGLPKHAKAGNINYALFTHGVASEFISVFDADMVCHPQFLRRTLPFFYNSTDSGEWVPNKVAFVQTPQRFTNVGTGDPLDLHQTSEYARLHPALDALGAAVFVGTGATVRMQALRDVGGIPYGCLIEDVHLSVVLHQHGYLGRYLNEDLQHGHAPDTLKDTFGQRLRWVMGGTQLFSLHYMRIRGYWASKAMSWKAKLAYFAFFGGGSNLMLPLKVWSVVGPALVLTVPHELLYPVVSPGNQGFHDAALLSMLLATLLFNSAHLILPPDGGQSLRSRWNASCAFMTYFPLEMLACARVLTGHKLHFVVTDKEGPNSINKGRYHPLLWMHVAFGVVYFTYAVLCVEELRIQSMPHRRPLHVRGGGLHQPLDRGMWQIYALALLFLSWLLLMLTGVVAAVWKPLPLRTKEAALAHETSSLLRPADDDDDNIKDDEDDAI